MSDEEVDKLIAMADALEAEAKAIRRKISLSTSSFTKPYAEAGHDLDSLFRVGHYRCDRCGSAQIDLSEDMSYGPMSKCVPIEEPTHDA